jgi:KRAB domain-containing zinc finger protein
MCSLCDKSFKQKDSLNCHIKRHGVVEKKFQCDVCHKTFAKQAECMTHSAIHSEKRSFKCEFGGCDKAFKISQSLRVHKVTHSGLKPYQCQICENWFSAKKGLKSHIQGVHKKEKSHACSQCDKSFFKSWDLKLHLNVHNEEKPYKCMECEVSLRSSASLIVHMRGHSGEKPFHCETCGKDFNQGSNMRTHKKTHLK